MLAKLLPKLILSLWLLLFYFFCIDKVSNAWLHLSLINITLNMIRALSLYHFPLKQSRISIFLILMNFHDCIHFDYVLEQSKNVHWMTDSKTCCKIN